MSDASNQRRDDAERERIRSEYTWTERALGTLAATAFVALVIGLSIYLAWKTW